MVDRLDRDAAKAFRAENLGSLLINRLWFGHLDVDSHDRLLQRFYSQAPPEIASDHLRAVGIGLHEVKHPESELMSRVTALWNFRVAAVESGADAGELAEFGRWFTSGHFDAEWSLRQLLVALIHAGNVENHGPVFARVADLATDHLQLSLAVLYRWVSSARHSYRLTPNLGSIRRILTVGVAGNSTALVTSKKVISVLIRDHGIHDLRDLLPGNTSDTAESQSED